MGERLKKQNSKSAKITRLHPDHPSPGNEAAARDFTAIPRCLHTHLFPAVSADPAGGKLKEGLFLWERNVSTSDWLVRFALSTRKKDGGDREAVEDGVSRLPARGHL